jgi:hypothetical protein
MGLVSFSKFVKEYKKKFPSSSINILEEVGNNVIIEDEFGKCKIRKQHLLNGITPSINSSLDKNYYFKNKANKIHNSKYNYSLVDYISANKKITIICNVHGKFNQEANSHLNGRGCPICKNFIFQIIIQIILQDGQNLIGIKIVKLLKILNHLNFIL